MNDPAISAVPIFTVKSRCFVQESRINVYADEGILNVVTIKRKHGEESRFDDLFRPAIATATVRWSDDEFDAFVARLRILSESDSVAFWIYCRGEDFTKELRVFGHTPSFKDYPCEFPPRYFE